MAWPVTERFLTAIGSPHTLAVRVDVTWPDGSVTEDLPVGSEGSGDPGEVTVDASSRVRRTLTLNVPDQDAWRDIVLGGAEIRPYRGVEYTDGRTELCPLGVFEVRGTTLDLSRMTAGKLTAPDRWRRVQRARFYSPYLSTDAITLREQWRQLVQGSQVTDVGFADSLTSDARVPYTVWERDRAAACDDLAAVLGAEGYFDVLGTATLRPVPVVGEPVWLLKTNDDTAVILTAQPERADERAYSAVIVNPSRTDGTPPFERVVVEDTNPLSFTFVGGRFGRVPRFYSSPLITTAEQANDAAQAILAAAAGYGESTALTSIVNPALEAGDTIEIYTPEGRRERHVLDAFTVPLSEQGAMPLKTRSQTLPEEGAE